MIDYFPKVCYTNERNDGLGRTAKGSPMSQIDNILRNLEKKHSSSPVGLVDNGAGGVSYATSSGKASYPLSLKSSDVNRKKGIITSYLTVYNNFDGSPFID